MRTVADAMAAPPMIVEPAPTIQDTSAAMLDARAHAAVVVDDGRACGIATAEDVSRALAYGYDAVETLVGVIAERDPPLARPDEPLAEVHQRMRADASTSNDKISIGMPALRRSSKPGRSAVLVALLEVADRSTTPQQSVRSRRRLRTSLGTPRA